MRSKIGEKAERRRKLTRLRVRKFRGSKIDSEESIYDIPKDLDASKYWRRCFRLRKVRLDGYLASDKGNNFQNISKDKFRVLKILNDNEKFYWVFYGLSKRKTDWVKKLLEIFAENKNLSELIQYFGKYQIARQILFDTNPQKGRLYSSIKGAVEYWEKNRLQNYEPNWE